MKVECTEMADIPKISIIVPVYNVEDYLVMCLDSIVKQTYKNLEIILIDDGSTDNSGRICDEYATRDSRIVAIHQDNQGVAQARNKGISIAQGEFIMFVDSDDWVDLNICEALTEALIQNNVQSVMCAYVREYPNKSLPRMLPFANVIWSGKQFQRKLCGLLDEELKTPEILDSYAPMVAKLYPRKAIIERQVTGLHLIGTAEDLLYNLEVFCHIDTVFCLNEPLYHYRKALSSSITGAYKPKLECQWDNLYSKILRVIQDNQFNSSYTDALNNRIALNILGIGLNCIQDNSGFREKYTRIKKALSHERRNEALHNLPLKYMPLHWKLFYYSAKHKFTPLFFMLLMCINKLKGKV